MTTTHANSCPTSLTKRLGIVNVVFIGAPGAGSWLLVDAGIGGTCEFIRNAAEERFGEHARPAAIIMTHGHFDQPADSKRSPKIGRFPSMPMNWSFHISMAVLPIRHLTQPLAEV